MGERQEVGGREERGVEKGREGWGIKRREGLKKENARGRGNPREGRKGKIKPRPRHTEGRHPHLPRVPRKSTGREPHANAASSTLREPYIFPKPFSQPLLSQEG